GDVTPCPGPWPRRVNWTASVVPTSRDASRGTQGGDLLVSSQFVLAWLTAHISPSHPASRTFEPPTPRRHIHPAVPSVARTSPPRRGHGLRLREPHGGRNEPQTDPEAPGRHRNRRRREFHPSRPRRAGTSGASRQAVCATTA